jgi:hypothetical protein
LKCISANYDLIGESGFLLAFLSDDCDYAQEIRFKRSKSFKPLEDGAETDGWEKLKRLQR